MDELERKEMCELVEEHLMENIIDILNEEFGNLGMDEFTMYKRKKERLCNGIDDKQLKYSINRLKSQLKMYIDKYVSIKVSQFELKTASNIIGLRRNKHDTRSVELENESIRCMSEAINIAKNIYLLEHF